MQIPYQTQFTPARTFLAALVALLAAGVIGFSLGNAHGAGQVVGAPTQPVVTSVTHTTAGEAFPYGPADRDGR